MKKFLVGVLSAMLLFNPVYSSVYADSLDSINTGEVSSETVLEKAVEEEYPVLQVIDGDTIRLDMNGVPTLVRLLQIDAPERKMPDGKKDNPFGQTALKFTQKFLKDKKVTLEYDVERFDQYGRTLAYVWYWDDGNKICLNQQLVKNSLAKTVLYGKNVKKYEEYLTVERSVRSAKQGIWKNMKSAYPSKNGYAKEIKQENEQLKLLKMDTAKKIDAEAPTINSPSIVQQTLATQDSHHVEKHTTSNKNSHPVGEGHIKGNKRSKIYHLPGMVAYDRISPKNIVYFETEEEAIANGYRRAKK